MIIVQLAVVATRCNYSTKRPRYRVYSCHLGNEQCTRAIASRSN